MFARPTAGRPCIGASAANAAPRFSAKRKNGRRSLSFARGRSTIPIWRRPRRPFGRNQRRNGHASTPLCLRLKNIRLRSRSEPDGGFAQLEGAGPTTMLFMVVEHFRDNDMIPVYRRLRESGRSLPEGLEYIDSWVEANFSRCFQVMRCDALES